MFRRILGLFSVLVVAGCGVSDGALPERAAPVVTSAPPTSTVSETEEPAGAPDASDPAATETAGTTEQAAPAAAAARARPWTLEPYFGFGAWLDAFDWSVRFARAVEHTVGPEAVDHMAAEGVQTIYIQAGRWNAETDVIERDRLKAIIDRAHAHDMSVVAWYLPTMVDPEADLRRLLAIAELDIDGLGVDIESRDVDDVAERNRRLLDITARLDAAMGGRPLAAIVMEPVVMEDVNPNYWPGYPWAELARYYDVWMPMGYWTNRVGAWRSAYDYTGVNIARIRQHIGDPDAPVHPIGGIGNETTVEDLHGMLTAAVEQRSIGGSIYDYRTTRPEHWDVLRSFRHQR